MAIIARQFGCPRGPLGRLIGHGMARANAGFSRWVIVQIAGHYRGGTGLAFAAPGDRYQAPARVRGNPRRT